MKAKKYLGQNFLKSKIALRKIIEAGEIKKDDVILEIGPGRGTLTGKLLEKAKTVIAVEKDRELFEFLKIKFAEQIKSGSLALVHGDILEFSLGNCKLSAKTYKLISNIPYNITGAILKKFLTEKNQPDLMVLMVQHEVARRIIARDGKESILSISVKAYGEPKMVAKVDKRYFSPIPAVNSAIISIKNISRKIFSAKGGSASGGEDMGIDEEKFWEIVKTGFAHKRKKLSSNLKGICAGPYLISLGDKRAEDLSLLDWINLLNN
ncbi:MAG TPA: 16S rRNA (adenine(1518)-N(6)/adenine(1519)-N(6))-dimethyltransferase RsmA [Candidatus Paceibacterota bacterium]|nr:16S rRNA (adenine(1518)-N(6)/adenine(1519)-N(6))-dimethyltransferase RsmA [Candidatus Paceibacterota bacterium]